MRTARILLALILVLGAGFIIVGEQLTGASARAVVNARLTTLRAPIAGEISLTELTLGTKVADGEYLGRIVDPLVDAIRLDDLNLERSVAQVARARLTEQVSAINDTLDILTDRATRYRVERTRQLEAEIQATQSRVAAAQARVEEASAILERAKQLTSRGVTTEAALDQAQANAHVAARVLDQTRSEGHILEIQLEAAKAGVFLGDSYNDAPYSEQRAEELHLRRRELESQLQETNARISALIDRINFERRRVSRLGEAAIKANVNGQLWELLAADGEQVQRGQDILRIVDCASTIATLSVSESVYNRLQIGDTAKFRINGETVVFSGTVARLAGSGAETIYSNLAVAPSERHLEGYDVAMIVPALREHPVLGCSIGRTGRAFFQRRPLDWLRNMWADWTT